MPPALAPHSEHLPVLLAEALELLDFAHVSGQEVQLTRHGLEEYVSDCVIFLDHRVANQTATRRLRIVKYRGSTHGTNEFPFLIAEDGISILPITSLALKHEVTEERISSG